MKHTARREIVEEVSNKWQIRSGQVRMWRPEPPSKENSCFIVMGVREWDDHVPTAVLMIKDEIIDDYYLQYVYDYSILIEDNPLNFEENL